MVKKMLHYCKRLAERSAHQRVQEVMLVTEAAGHKFCIYLSMQNSDPEASENLAVMPQVFRRSIALVEYPDLAKYHPKPDFEIRYLNKKAPKKSKKARAADAEADGPEDKDRPVPLADDASMSFKSTSSTSTLSAVSVQDIAAVDNKATNTALSLL